jgi:DNA-binding NtrC family response regulator
LPQQVKLLRLIETRRYRRVGGVEPIASDVRLLVATHRDLDAMVHDGSFRADLFYRINAFPIRLPPLRERREDIAVLAESLLERMSANKNLVLAPDALQALQLCDFPGNVRELRNSLERASLLADSGVIHAEHLPCSLPVAKGSDTLSTNGEAVLRSAGRAPSDAELKELLRARRGSRKELAKVLGISERTLYRRLKSLQRQ